jgi:hypothetical protein
MMMSEELAVGSQCRVQLEKGLTLTAEVRWRTDLDSEVMASCILNKDAA